MRERDYTPYYRPLPLVQRDGVSTLGRTYVPSVGRARREASYLREQAGTYASDFEGDGMSSTSDRSSYQRPSSFRVVQGAQESSRTSSRGERRARSERPVERRRSGRDASAIARFGLGTRDDFDEYYAEYGEDAEDAGSLEAPVDEYDEYGSYGESYRGTYGTGYNDPADDSADSAYAYRDRTSWRVGSDRSRGERASGTYDRSSNGKRASSTLDRASGSGNRTGSTRSDLTGSGRTGADLAGSTRDLVGSTRSTRDRGDRTGSTRDRASGSGNRTGSTRSVRGRSRGTAGTYDRSGVYDYNRPTARSFSPLGILALPFAFVRDFVGYHMRVCAIVLAIALTFAMLFTPARNLYVAKRQLQELQATYDELAAENKAIQDEINYLLSDQGVEDEARARGYVAEGETKVVVEGLDLSDDEDPTSMLAPAEVVDDRPWYIRFLDWVFRYKTGA